MKMRVSRQNRKKTGRRPEEDPRRTGKSCRLHKPETVCDNYYVHMHTAHTGWRIPEGKYGDFSINGMDIFQKNV